MKTNTHFVRTAVAVAVAGFCSTTFAAGFQLNEHSASGLGRAFAGDAAIAENASVIARNPASMSKFDGMEFSFALSYINPEIDVEGKVTNGAAGQFNEAAGADILQTEYDASYDDVTPDAFIPTVYFLMPLNDKVHIGVGAFSNYGLSTDYGDGYVASEFANEVSITTFNIQPSVSYKLTDTLAIGLGVNIVYADAELENTTPEYFDGISAAFQSVGQSYPTGGLTAVEMEGDDIAFGWNLGLLWDVTPSTSISLHYRSEVDVTFDGDIYSHLMVPGEVLDDSGSLDLDLPSVAEFSLHHAFDDQFSLQFSATLTGWDSFEELRADTDHKHGQAQQDSFLLKEENFEDSWRYAIGGTYVLNQNWTLRAGYSYDEAAVGDKYRTISIPDTDRHWITLGASYVLNEQTTLDFGYGHIFADDDAPVT